MQFMIQRYIHQCPKCRKEYVAYVKCTLLCTCGAETTARKAEEPEVRKVVEHARKRSG